MIDWTASMQQTYEFYKVDPYTWQDVDLLTMIESCNISRDGGSDTLGSASFNTTDVIDECYIRVYLKCIQNGFIHRECLGTFLVQTPSIKFNGKINERTMDGYTSLIELKNTYPSIGYTLRKDINIMDSAYEMCIDHMRAPVVKPVSDKQLYDHFVANVDDTWFSYISDLISQANFSFDLDSDGKVLFQPYTELNSMQPVWIFDDSNSSILLPDISDERDLYNVPNVVEVVYSVDTMTYFSRVVNDDPNSIVSTVRRGREIVKRDTNPSISEDMQGDNAQEYLDAYAEKLLKDLSSLEHKITYSHGYCPVRLGDCVLLNYKRAGIHNIRAKVTQQNIECITGCTVSETAVYTTQLWR